MPVSRTRTRRVLPLFLFALPLVGACVGACAPTTTPRPPVVEGMMASGGGALGDWDLYPTRCTRKGAVAVLDRDGDSERKILLFDRSTRGSATASKVEVHLQQNKPEGVTDIQLSDPTCVTGSLDVFEGQRTGDLKIDCTTGEGGHVVGALRFKNCL